MFDRKVIFFCLPELYVNLYFVLWNTLNQNFSRSLSENILYSRIRSRSELGVDPDGRNMEPYFPKISTYLLREASKKSFLVAGH